MRANRLAAVVFVLIFALLGGARAREEGEWTRAYPVYLPGLEPKDESGELTVVSARLLWEAENGLLEIAPRGAASFHTEETAPCSAGPRFVARGDGDEFGFVNVCRPPGGWGHGAHWHFEAPGRGAIHEYVGAVGFGEVVLPGGIDRGIRVIGPMGDPVSGAKISVFLGCPHSPTLRSGTTDEQGRIRLPNLPADWTGYFWVEAPGVDPGPYDLEPAWVGQGGDTILTEPGRTARGVVIESGAPVGGVTVLEPGYPRGPKTTTDRDGRFVLHGVEWARPLRFYRPGATYGGRPDAVVRDFEEDLPLRVVLHQGRTTAPGDGETHHAVDVVTGRNGRVPVALTRLADGLTVRGAVDDVFRALVPAGRYRVKAGGGFSRWAESSREIDLPSADGEAVRVPVERAERSLSIDWTKAGGGARHPELRIPGRKAELGYRQNQSLFAPPGVPVGLLVGPPARLLPFREDRLAVVAPPKNRIRFRVVDPAGDPVDLTKVTVGLDDYLPERRNDGSYEFRTWASGRRILHFGGLFAWKSVVVDLPMEEAGTVFLGTVVKPAAGAHEPRRIRLHPVSDALTCWIRETRDPEWGEVEMDPEGVLEVEAGRGPLRLLVEGEGRQPFAARIPDGDRVEIRLPTGWISGKLHGPDGGLLPGVVYVDASRYECPDGRFAVRGVAAGPHLVIAGVRDHVGEARRIVLAEGERRVVRFDLPRR